MPAIPMEGMRRHQEREIGWEPPTLKQRHSPIYSISPTFNDESREKGSGKLGTKLESRGMGCLGITTQESNQPHYYNPAHTE